MGVAYHHFSLDWGLDGLAPDDILFKETNLWIPSPDGNNVLPMLSSLTEGHKNHRQKHVKQSNKCGFLIWAPSTQHLDVDDYVSYRKQAIWLKTVFSMTSKIWQE